MEPTVYRASITGMGAVSALGTGCAALWEAIEAGRDGLRAVDRFDTAAFTSELAGLWPGWAGLRQAVASTERDLAAVAEDFPLVHLLEQAAREALEQARLTPADVPPGRTAILLGTCFGQGFRAFAEVAQELGRRLGLSGPQIVFSTACSSSTNAVGLGRDLILGGRADVVLALGGDVLLREVFAGFNALGVVSPQKCAPFSTPVGITLAEGAGALVIEAPERGARRGAADLVDVLGYGLSADAFHETTPDPTGRGIARAIRGALADAQLGPADVTYVSAHATGTESNDRTEWQAICETLGERVTVSANKSQLGHAQGAAGILELIVCVLAMRRGVVPPTLHFRGPRPGCPEDPVAGDRPRPRRVEVALNLSAAFGGANAVVAVGPARPPAAAHRGRRPVVVAGMGLLGPTGAGLPALRDRPAQGEVPAFDLREMVPTADPRRLDPSGRLLTAAAGLALREAEIELRGKQRERAGIFLGATRMPAESANRCATSIDQHGVGAASATAFSRMSVNAPAGACAKLLGLLGPSTTLSTGAGSGLLAIALAAEWLSHRLDADCLIAGGVDERPVAGAPAGFGSDTSGAACVLLRGAAEGGPRPEIEITGWGMAAAGDVAGAVGDACRGASVPRLVFAETPLAPGQLQGFGAPEKLEVFDVSRVWGNAEATRSAVAFCLALDCLRKAMAEAALVVSPGQTACTAVRLQSRRGGARQ